MKKTILSCMAIALFAVLMVFNVTTTLDSKTATEGTDITFTLSGLEAMAQTGGEWEIPPDVCSLYYPAIEGCTWQPVNCLCPIIVNP